MAVLTQDQAQALKATIADLRQRIAALPEVRFSRGDYMEQHRTLREAARALGQYLADTYSARIAEKPDATRITMHRISSTCTSGLEGAFKNWIAAAERRLAAEQKGA
ncbi:hypothetical protein [Paracoccus sp. TOH]|uniref:hypothetical protein n=1 Tax=Paracoccus sp. TOH TaxID=1263728 RepID=UPI0025B162EA|nr:hypothetical protein [Paracoccus sp. TOH]WJS87275.1 hypothetical protein NBE95_20565 [Paracoccus sp. TOH]